MVSQTSENSRRILPDWRKLLQQPVVNIVFIFVVFQILCIVFSVLYPNDFRYLSDTNIALVLKAIPVLGIISFGVGLLMISGEFDLSVGSVYTLTAYAMALLYSSGLPLWIALLLTLALAVLIGMLNGLITVKLAIPSFISTLGTMLLARGAVRWLSEGQSVSFHPDDFFTELMTGSFHGLEAPFIWFVALAILSGLVLHRTKLGNHMFLVGGNEKTAVAVGINSHGVKVTAFIFSALGATTGGIMSATRVSTVTPSQGLGLELKAIAVCVIGGLLLSGGRGTILGIFIGACLMYTVEDVLLLLRAPGFYLDMFVGAILVGAVVVNSWLARR
jgi:simple sugar transport system permease protein